MKNIRKATIEDADLLAIMGRVTYAESHGHFIEEEKDLSAYLDKAFSVRKIKEELLDTSNLFYMMIIDDTPVGYGKIVLGAQDESVTGGQTCRLERIYILKEFIHHRLGQSLFSFLEEKAIALGMDTMWLSVYVHNMRAINFYKRNAFAQAGTLSFLVNGKGYDNFILSKKLNV